MVVTLFHFGTSRCRWEEEESIPLSYLLHTDNAALTARIKGIIFSGPAFAVTEVPSWRGWFQNPFIRFSFHTHEHFLNPHHEPLLLLLFHQLLALVSVPLQDGLIELLSLPGLRNLFSPTRPDWVLAYLSDWQEERSRLRQDNYSIRRCVLRYVLAVEKEIISVQAPHGRLCYPLSAHLFGT